MSIKSDKWIRRMALKRKMIEPFAEGRVRKGEISYGVSAYGYDMRISDEFLLPVKTARPSIRDPKKPAPGLFRDFKGGVCVVPPNSFVLARSVEYFRLPRKRK
jgi:dCTP deaminase